MRCPVCKTECELSNVCHECGFSEVGKVFLGFLEPTQRLGLIEKVLGKTLGLGKHSITLGNTC